MTYVLDFCIWDIFPIKIDLYIFNIVKLSYVYKLNEF